MMGHAVSNQDEAYFEQNISALKELYKLHLPHLTFEHEIKIQSLNTEDAKKLSELEKTNATLEAKVTAMERTLSKMFEMDEEEIRALPNENNMDDEQKEYNRRIKERIIEFGRIMRKTQGLP